MAGSIKTWPVTEEYEDGWERTFGHPRDLSRVKRERGTEPCPFCGRIPRYADQHCACTATPAGHKG